jgi:hypothetical protein
VDKGVAVLVAGTSCADSLIVTLSRTCNSGTHTHYECPAACSKSAAAFC